MKNITLQDCINLYEKYGLMAVIKDGEVAYFYKNRRTPYELKRTDK